MDVCMAATRYTIIYLNLSIPMEKETTTKNIQKYENGITCEQSIKIRIGIYAGTYNKP